MEPGTAFDRAVRRGRWAPVDPDLAADLYDVTQAVLGRAGFDAYEVSNHARGEAARSRHNLVYWRGRDYVGAGPGAHGRLTLAGGARVATAAEPRVADYVARVRATGVGHPAPEALDARAVAEERLLMGLRTTEGVGFEELCALSLTADAAQVLDLADLGLVRADGGRLTATPRGRLVLDRLTAELASCAYARPLPPPGEAARAAGPSLRCKRGTTRRGPQPSERLPTASPAPLNILYPAAPSPLDLVRARA